MLLCETWPLICTAAAAGHVVSPVCHWSVFLVSGARVHEVQADNYAEQFDGQNTVANPTAVVEISPARRKGLHLLNHFPVLGEVAIGAIYEYQDTKQKQHGNDENLSLLQLVGI